MTQMTDYQRRCALDAIDLLLSYNISKMFSEPVDLKAFPTYLKKISKPMDLGTIRNKIINNDYNNIHEFKEDVQLVWENSNKFNGKQSLIASLAKTLQKIFMDKTEFFTGNDAFDWQNSAKKAAEKLSIKLNISVNGVHIEHKKAIETYSPPIEKKFSTRSSTRNKVPVKYDAENFEKEPIHVIEKTVKTEHKKEKRHHKDDLDDYAVVEVHSFEGRPLTFDEQDELIVSINNISRKGKELYEDQIIHCISEMQPELVKDGRVDISLDMLYDSTLIKLKRIVDDILKHVSL